jgi:type I restriction enzyme S subunit
MGAETKSGYKMTDVGLIPEDWEVKQFEDVIEGFSSGQTPYRAIKEYYIGDIPWITSGELNYNIITDTIEKINYRGVKAANLKILPVGTFLFAITGLEAAGTRGSCAITGIEATTNQSCMALYPKKDLLINEYLYYYYVRYGNELAFKYCQGTKQQSYTGAIAKKLPIIIPPSIAEQTAIANALKDTDDLINSLENLIAKKKLIKQGAMQELLKPKEGWVKKKLGEVCDVRDGTHESPKYQENGVMFITSKNLVNGNIDFSDVSFISEMDATKINQRSKVAKGDILMSMIGTIGNAVLIEIEPNFCIKNVALVKPKYINGKFLTQTIQSQKFQKYLESKLDGGIQKFISLGVLRELNVYAPNIIEQVEIAQQISNYELEINNFDTKLSKIKTIKQGMLQQLLTGKIRLV